MSYPPTEERKCLMCGRLFVRLTQNARAGKRGVCARKRGTVTCCKACARRMAYLQAYLREKAKYRKIVGVGSSPVSAPAQVHRRI